MVGKDNIENGLIGIVEKLIDEKKNIHFEEGENDAILILFSAYGKAFATLATIDDGFTPPKIMRQINTWSLPELITKLTENL